MRTLGMIVVIVVIVALGGWAVGLWDFDMAGGEAPEVEVTGGEAPETDATTGDVDVDVEEAPEAEAEAPETTQ